jgi:hypothetical protein
MIELSWLNSSAALSDSSLLTEDIQLSASISGTIIDRIVWKELYLKNNTVLLPGSTGQEIAYNVKFFAKSSGDNNAIENILRWSRMTDGAERPYGMFIVFGYIPSGTTSYIDKFKTNTITPLELSLFQVNHFQGASAKQGISLGTARRYIEGGYSTSSAFEPYSDSAGTLPSTSECSGLVKVLVGIRLPDDITVSRSLVDVSLSYEEIS